MVTSESYTDIQILQNHDFEMLLTFDGLDILSTHEYAAVIAIDKEHTEFQGPKWGGSAWSQAAVNVVPFTIIADQSADTVKLTLPGIATRFFTDKFEGVWDLVQKDTSGAADVYTRQSQGAVVVSAGATRISDTFTASVA